MVGKVWGRGVKTSKFESCSSHTQTNGKVFAPHFFSILTIPTGLRKRCWWHSAEDIKLLITKHIPQPDPELRGSCKLVGLEKMLRNTHKKVFRFGDHVSPGGASGTPGCQSGCQLAPRALCGDTLSKKCGAKTFPLVCVCEELFSEFEVLTPLLHTFLPNLRILRGRS